MVNLAGPTRMLVGSGTAGVKPTNLIPLNQIPSNLVNGHASTGIHLGFNPANQETIYQAPSRPAVNEIKEAVFDPISKYPIPRR